MKKNRNDGTTYTCATYTQVTDRKESINQEALQGANRRSPCKLFCLGDGLPEKKLVEASCIHNTRVLS